MDFLNLIRYKNLLIILLTIVLTKYALINTITPSSYIANFNFFLFVISILLITASGNLINDIFDIEADLINKPKKTIVSKRIPVSIAWKYYWILSVLGLLLAVYSLYNLNSLKYIFIHLFSWVLLFLYTKFFKPIAILGNVLIAILCALTILYTYIIHLNVINTNEKFNYFLFYLVSFYTYFALLTTLIREIIKDIIDIKGDNKVNVKTLPIVLGRDRAKNITIIVTIFLLVTLITAYIFVIPFISLLVYFQIFITIPLLYFLYKLLKASSKKEYVFLSAFIKVIMLMGILSMLLFTNNFYKVL